MRVMIAGLGSIGTRHSRNFRALGLDVTGFDPHPERRAAYTEATGFPTVPTLEAAVASAPDLAVIASPNVFHVPQALAFAQAGSHLFIEKPLAVSLEGVQALADLVADRGLFAHVGSNWKFHASFQAMKGLLEQEAIGRVVGAQVLAGQYLPDWHPWEDYRQMYSARKALGGGVVFDTHEFDYLTWLLGPVDEAFGFVGHSGTLEIETDDVASVVLRLASGALCSLQLDYLQRDYRRRYHITGERGTIEWDVRRGQVWCYDAGSKSDRVIDCPLDDVNAMYMDQARHVIAGVEGREAPKTPIVQAMAVLTLQLGLVSPRSGASRG